MNIIVYILWLPFVFSLIVFSLAVLAYYSQRSLRRLIAATLLFYISLAALKTWLQFQVWSQTELGKVLLNSPLDQNTPGIFGQLGFLTAAPGGYFFFYALSRFWFSVLATVLVALLFYSLLKLLEKNWPHLFEASEPELGLLTALLVGWPLFALFLPLTLGLTVVFSLTASLFWKKNRVTIGQPMLLAAALSLLLGDFLSQFIPLGLLKI